MNKQSINKLTLFLTGLQSRFTENNSIFKGIYVSFFTGLKEFKGVGHYEDGKIKYNFNGRTEFFDIDNLFKKLMNDAEVYDVLSFIYKERGTDILITADNKNVKMTNTPVSEEELTTNNSSAQKQSHSFGETSTLLNRDYYIKVGKADALLKEIGIMSKEGKIKNDKIRKYNQIDHYVELLEGILDRLPKNQTVNILDCGCGKSYLTFVLNYYLTEVKKKKCHFIGLDYSEGVISASKKMAENLGYRNMEFHAMDINNYMPDKKINVVISLHACDTATDMAMALGVRVNSDVIIAVPCCHRELLNQYSYEPFKGILKHGVFKARMADILTDGMRSLLLEAKGYEVSVVEYISPLETPKNLMIRAIKTKDENAAAMDDYFKLMSSLNVYPALYDYINR
ncbi:SAM-dependent methyltransferase [Clostridium sp. YIM B02515]|uniref:SAM-dependent methyltransferase n=1 Tax=Clostridium rhizosphaerae TaxID=2803861 RepID=A0ABS1TGC2_9CLOT|nr:SAM-dependent methyltransferase [Clostridium rhizosphaerae]MBL4938443.1 SAM-dependent methyltransferase [Clostridium rhizosphaerae]